MNNGRTRRGFTLLEVTLAAAIFAAAAVVLSTAFSNALTAMGNMRRESNEEPLFRHVRSLAVTIPDLDNFEQGEELLLPDDAKAEWTAKVEPTTVADLFRVELTISLHLKNDSEPRVEVSHLYLLRPTWSDADDRAKIIEEAKTRLTDERRTLQ